MKHLIDEEGACTKKGKECGKENKSYIVQLPVIHICIFYIPHICACPFKQVMLYNELFYVLS